jgi:hypothetical protein
MRRAAFVAKTQHNTPQRICQEISQAFRKNVQEKYHPQKDFGLLPDFSEKQQWKHRPHRKIENLSPSII